MEILRTLDAVLIRIIHPILIVVGLSVATLLAVGIFSRAILGAPIFGLEELMLMGIMWFYMLGAALASREKSHLSADFVKVMTNNRKIWKIAALVSTAISLFVAIMFVTWAWDLASWGIEKGQSTPVFGLPWWISQSSLFVASILFVAYLTRDLIQEIRGTGAADDPETTETEAL